MDRWTEGETTDRSMEAQNNRVKGMMDNKKD